MRLAALIFVALVYAGGIFAVALCTLQQLRKEAAEEQGDVDGFTHGSAD